ncbi:MAG TPA: methyltransferase domain-containing protein [Acidimicrobiales bacterium]|nr:methyltransferase domain-containing protein [Acidimicrobiales bacterium]
MPSASPGQPSPGVQACTIIARNYLPAARVLARSFVEHNPDGQMHVLVLDDPLGEIDAEQEPFEVLRLGDLAAEPGEMDKMAACYTVMELATAVKPWLLHTLLGRTDAVLYLDPDIQVFHPLDHLSAMAREHGIVLTPHRTTPMPRDGKMPTETAILGSGIYNLGFVAVSHGAGPFLAFWMERLRRECVVDPSNMRFVDQRWVDFVPGIFECVIERDPACNVAYWNLDERDVRVAGTTYTVDGKPLKFFHFSGYSPKARHILSKHQLTENPRILLSERPAVRRICDQYGDLLSANGFGTDDTTPYGLDSMANGVRFDPIIRELYRDWLAEAEAGSRSSPPDPFTARGAAELLEVLNRAPDVPDDPGHLTLYQATLFGRRPDIRAAIHDPQGADRQRFFDWLGQEATAGRIDPHLARPPARPSGPIAAPGGWAPPDRLSPGINLVGYLRAELGVGQGARLLADALATTGIPYATLVNTRTTSRQDHRFDDRASDRCGDYDVNIVCANADQLPLFAAEVGPGFFAGRHTIGQWAWELEDFPDDFAGAFGLVDEIWAVSEFTRAAIARRTDKPVFAVPHPITAPAVPPGVGRDDLGLPEDRTVFLFCFDALSVPDRKNPLGLVEAYTTAFPTDAGTTLVIKVINGDKRIPDMERLRLAIGERPDILLIDRYLDAARVAALMAAADCYVSLHRSEGFGLTMAEAMALGKPVVATAYSGNLDFMTADTAYLVDWSPGPVPAGCEPYRVGATWAEPDLDHAARLLRQVHEHPDEAAEVGRRAREAVGRHHSIGQRAAFIRQRFDAIQAERAALVVAGASSPPAPATGSDRLTALASSRPSLETTSQRLPGLTRFYRRLVLRAQRHHDDHQRTVNTALAEALGALEDDHRELASELSRSLAQERAVSSSASAALAAQLAEHARVLEAHGARVEAIRTDLRGDEESVGELDDRLGATSATLDRLAAEMRAIPYMSDPTVLATRDDKGRPAIGYRGAGGAARSYAGFEDLFRGAESFITERQRYYLRYLVDHEPVVDVGCGRGEMLALLAEAGVESVGVDLDPSMVERANRRGLDVEMEDGVAYLEKRDEGSVGCVFSAQVIEHIEHPDLVRLHREAHRALRSGGLFVAETVNPHSVAAFKSFWTDLTHKVPIFPEVEVALCLAAGFSEAIVVFPNGTGDLDQDRFEQGEYAVIATK